MEEREIIFNEELYRSLGQNFPAVKLYISADRSSILVRYERTYSKRTSLEEVIG